MDSFDFLYSLTSRLKENVAIESGLVDVDTGQVTGRLEEHFASVSPLVRGSQGFLFGSHVFDCGSYSDENVILPPAPEALLEALSQDSENEARRAAVQEYLSAPAPEWLADTAGNTVRLISDMVAAVDETEPIHDVLEAFIPSGEDGTLNEVLSLQVVLSVFSRALGHFEQYAVNVDDIIQALDAGIDGVQLEYIDSMALALGQGKSLARLTGSVWLYDALNSVLVFVRVSL